MAASKQMFEAWHGKDGRKAREDFPNIEFAEIVVNIAIRLARAGKGHVPLGALGHWSDFIEAKMDPDGTYRTFLKLVPRKPGIYEWAYEIGDGRYIVFYIGEGGELKARISDYVLWDRLVGPVGELEKQIIFHTLQLSGCRLYVR